MSEPRKFVIVKHNDNGKFLFYVPAAVDLRCGDKVVCETVRGNAVPGVCCCDSFMALPDVVCPLFGTQEKAMKYVTGRIKVDMFDLNETEDEGDG